MNLKYFSVILLNVFTLFMYLFSTFSVFFFRAGIAQEHGILIY